MEKGDRGQKCAVGYASDGAKGETALSVGLTAQDRPFWQAAFVLVDRCGRQAALRAVQQVRLALAEDRFERAQDWDRVLQAIHQIDEMGPPLH